MSPQFKIHSIEEKKSKMVEDFLDQWCKERKSRSATKNTKCFSCINGHQWGKNGNLTLWFQHAKTEASRNHKEWPHRHITWFTCFSQLNCDQMAQHVTMTLLKMNAAKWLCACVSQLHARPYSLDLQCVQQRQPQAGEGTGMSPHVSTIHDV